MITRNPVLEIKNLTKHFGRIKAVHSLDLSIEAGQVFGILGPNGSGKTTTLGMILDIVHPTSGSYAWFGGEEPQKSRIKVGSLLENAAFYPYLNAIQNLKITAHIKELINPDIEGILRLVGLWERAKDPVKTYSLGMKQRLAIAGTLIGNPEVLLLDEPTNGLDPEGIAEVRELIEKIALQGKTILLASHLLDEVQKVCTDFCIMKKGQKVYQGAVKEILHEINQVEISAESLEELHKFLEEKPEIERIATLSDALLVTLGAGVDAAKINRWCFEQGIVLKRLVTRTNSLEMEFLKILKEN